jgi:hypothetical protein
MFDPDRRQPFTVDQQLALNTAAVRLARDLANTFSKETIERFLYSSYDQFAVFPRRTKSYTPRTSSSRWVAATHAQCFPASGLKLLPRP